MQEIVSNLKAFFEDEALGFKTYIKDNNVNEQTSKSLIVKMTRDFFVQIDVKVCEIDAEISATCHKCIWNSTYLPHGEKPFLTRGDYNDFVISFVKILQKQDRLTFMYNKSRIFKVRSVLLPNGRYAILKGKKAKSIRIANNDAAALRKRGFTIREEIGCKNDIEKPTMKVRGKKTRNQPLRPRKYSGSLDGVEDKFPKRKKRK